MRPLEESEIQQVFEKLFKFVGKNLKNIVDRADQPHCFRLHKKVGYAAVFGMGKQSRHREPSYPNNFMAMQIVKPTPFFKKRMARITLRSRFLFFHTAHAYRIYTTRRFPPPLVCL